VPFTLRLLAAGLVGGDSSSVTYGEDGDNDMGEAIVGAEDETAALLQFISTCYNGGW
jgi:hypothetical protein